MLVQSDSLSFSLKPVKICTLLPLDLKHPFPKPKLLKNFIYEGFNLIYEFPNIKKTSS